MRNKHSHLLWIGCAASVFSAVLAMSAAGISKRGFFVKPQEKGETNAMKAGDLSITEQSGFYCNLKAFTPAELIRHGLLTKKIAGARFETTELANGFAFRLQNEIVSLADLAEWVAGERKCCPFFDFDIELERDGGPLWLKLQGRDGVKLFMRDEFGIAPSPTSSLPSSSALSSALDAWVTNTEQLVVPAADAMPENRYSFTPATGCKGDFNGVRTFAEQVKHLAAANFQLGALTLGEKPPHGEHGEAAPESLLTKAQIMDYARDSFVYLHKAAVAIDEKNASETIDLPRRKNAGTRVGFLVDALAHSQNHYGQLIEYLRMNGLVPPASR